MTKLRPAYRIPGCLGNIIHIIQSNKTALLKWILAVLIVELLRRPT